MKIEKDIFFEKVYGCWAGKNIGGTLGAPYDRSQEILNIEGFSTNAGEVVPNDNLDLQLVWLTAIEKYGPKGITPQNLGELWIDSISSQWNEYGIAKTNMREGIAPPLSGEYENVFKNANGAWIRSEIWACCTPGRPDIAVKYAYYDACVDHGISEGTYAEIFTAAVESAAFEEKDPETLIQIGLSYIPKDSRVYKSIEYVLESYTNAYGWKKTREDIVEQNSDIGWGQSPTNLAFVIIGWLYGEGDFKKSLKIAINCGDNTLCTAATLGSILGITGGYGCIPSDWKSYVGNDIRTVAIDRTALTNIPETCTELAERVSKAAWQVLADHGGLNEDNTAFAGCLFKEMLFASADIKAWLNNLSCETVYDFCHTSVGVTYIGGITIKAGEIREIKVRVKNLSPCRQLYDIEYFMPDGFQVIEPVNHVSVYTETSLTTDQNIFSVKVRAGEIIKTKNRGIIQIIASGRPTVILIPILFIG